MKLETFFDNFDVLAEAPNSVKKLREMILQLAVRGKLVAQDEKEEPAAVLLKRIKIQRDRLIKERKIKNTEPLPPIDSDGVQYSIPKSWQWVYLGEIGQVVGGGTPDTKNPDYFTEKGISWLTPADLYGLKHKYIGQGRRDLTERGLKESSAQLMPAGTVIFSSRAPIGYVAITKNDLATNQGFKSLIPYIIEMNEYIYYFLKKAGKEIDESASGTTFKEIPGKDFIKIQIPLPPLAEQHRIVAKVDQLISLCDELEARQQKKRESRAHINSAALDRLLAAHAPGEFAEGWRRISDNFDLLYDAPENVGALRKAILQLAVMGKLVEQDKRDEPAEVLIEKIKAEKTNLFKARKIKKIESFISIEKEEVRFDIPDRWKWVRFGEITICRDGERIPVSKDERETREKIFDYYGASGIIDKIDNYLFDKPLLLIGEDGANLLSRSTPIAFIAQGKYWVNNHAHVIDSISLDCLRYLEVFINAINLAPYVTGTAQPKMNQEKMNSIEVSFPPIAEQHRIVARVDQLMSLCDNLEAGLLRSQADSEKLMEAVVGKILVSA